MIVPVAPVAVDVMTVIVRASDPVLLLCTSKTRKAALAALEASANERKNKCIVVDADIDRESKVIRSFDELLRAGKEGKEYSVPDNATIENGTRLCVFSSGSTGRPKGIVSSSKATQFPSDSSRLYHLNHPWVSMFW